MAAICPHCKKEFKKEKNSQRYCSQECCEKAKELRYEQAKEERKEQAVCIVCGKTFKRKTYERTCSEECKKVLMKKDEVVCKTCGKPFLPTKEHRKFCSAKCKEKAKYVPKEKKPKLLKKISISEIAREAREKGLSYGKYVEQYEKINFL
jgi:predicted nucleic acid-binding Zn ribbon protein